jgi:hypothetical protein
MKYRIKKRIMENGDILFTPQYKYKYIPLWIDFTVDYPGGAILTENYETLKEAQNRIEEKKEIEMSYITKEKEYIDYK